MTQFRMSLNWLIVTILLASSFEFNASETGSEVVEASSSNSSISRNRRCSLVGRQCRLRLVAPCPERICRPSQTIVREEIRHISSAPIVHEVHHQQTTTYSKAHRVEQLVQEPIPIIQQKVEHIVQEPVPIIQQKVEHIVQEPVPVIQQRVEHIIQEPVPIVQETQQIVQEHLPIIQQRVEQIHIHKPVVSLRITACPEGHYLSPDGTHCKHIDCERGLEFSDILLRCVDINECLVPTACLSDEQCINTYASYICRKICTQAGHRLNEARNTCEDIDECIEGLHGCGPQQNCINTPGSYRCECPIGYRISGSRCDDINECLESHQHLCPYDTSLCENVPGSFYCKCRPGFEKDFKGRCADLDECAINNGGCSQRCVNKFGSFECHCNNGYKLSPDGRTCIDIDECTLYAESGICSPQTSICENTPGSYRCRCKTGFRDPDGQGKHCTDLDECIERTNLCEQRCLNTFGSYKCACNRGYRLVDAHRCEDIDECHEGDVINSISYSRFYHSEDGHPKLCQGSCENTAGSYHCRCPHGYNLEHNHHCVDIDECSEHGYCKGSNQTCVNIGGSFRCVDTQCPARYYREGSQCKFKERLVYAEICDDPTETCDIDQIICYSYAYIAFRSKMVKSDQSKGTTRGHEFFTFVVPVEPPIIVDFKFRLVTVKSPRHGVRPSVKDDFEMRRTKDNEVRLAIQSSLEGPQDIELEIEARMYKNGLQIGKNIAIVTVFISEYEF